MNPLSKPVHVGEPYNGNKDRLFTRMEGILERNWLTNDGPCVQEFEHTFAEFHDGVAVAAVANATIGLELALRALGVCGDVLLPSFTFVATAHSVRSVGARPVFVDIDPETHLIDVGSCAQNLTESTQAILAVDIWGQPSLTTELLRFARDSGLKIIVDAAHSALSSHPEHALADAVVWSLHATKILNSAEGGFVGSPHPHVVSKLRSMRNFGFEGLDHVTEWGTNAKMTEFSAAIGLTNLESCPEFLGHAREIRCSYRESIQDLPWLSFVEFSNENNTNHHYCVSVLDPKLAEFRDDIVMHLWNLGVRARRYFWPGVHRMRPYQDQISQCLSVTEDIANRTVVLPNGPSISPELAKDIVSEMHSFVQQLNGIEVVAA